MDHELHLFQHVHSIRWIHQVLDVLVILGHRQVLVFLFLLWVRSFHQVLVALVVLVHHSIQRVLVNHGFLEDLEVLVNLGLLVLPFHQ